MKRILLMILALHLGAFFCGGVHAADLLLVKDKKSLLPIAVDKNATAETKIAAKELASYIQKISGATPSIIETDSQNAPEHAIWVGEQPALNKVFPELKTDFKYPEEILMIGNEKDILIIGRDKVDGDRQFEYGTANAVYTFIEKYLDVRWFWPGELGEDVIKKDTIALVPFEYSFHPVFVKRKFWPGNLGGNWLKVQRIQLFSGNISGGHSFTDWWDKYHKEHPDYFAMQANGKRDMPRDPKTVKICISNPAVWKQWLDNAEEKLKNDKSLVSVPATPNDGPWHCTCEKCRAWDYPNAPKDVLTERHVKFWNQLAKGLKERFPDRTAYVVALAYAAYATPPVEEKLEPNIAIAQVGFYPFTDEANRAEQKKQWLEWASKATLMYYRPNLWYWGGGVWGFPEVAFKNTMEDFRFLADNHCIGIEVDVFRRHWATQGPQYYLMAKMTYDPYQDGDAVMKDYYKRAFGPAADEMEEYWNFMEAGSAAVKASPNFQKGSAKRFVLPDVLYSVYNDDFMKKASDILDKADAKLKDAPAVYKKRVAFVRSGLDVVTLLSQNIPLMKKVRDSYGKDTESVNKVRDNWKKMEKLADSIDGNAIAFSPLVTAITGKGYMGGMQDYFGPPSEELLNTKKLEKVDLMPAKWKLVFSDDFQRKDLGADWKVASGSWAVENGSLITKGDGTIMLARKFSGLQKITFDAVAAGNPGISDISTFIHSGTGKDAKGYLLQFGGNYNKNSTIQKAGKVVKETQNVIEPGKKHSIAAEYDGIKVRLTVDGKTILEYPDSFPLLGDGQEYIGFYVYEGIVKISNVKVYTSEAIPKKQKQDVLDNNGIKGFE